MHIVRPATWVPFGEEKPSRMPLICSVFIPQTFERLDAFLYIFQLSDGYGYINDGFCLKSRDSRASNVLNVHHKSTDRSTQYTFLFSKKALPLGRVRDEFHGSSS
jgi:hypothetical protein